MMILVAGGAGFVGSHLSRALLDAGHLVWVVDDLSSGRLENVRDLKKRRGFVLQRESIVSRPRLAAVSPREIDVVVHLASPASPVDYERRPLDTLLANSIGTLNLAELTLRADARLVYVSTSEVYGDPLVHPQSEDYWGNVNPIGPRSCYDEGKRFGEAVTWALRRERGLRASIVRVFNTYGPAMRRDDGRAVPEMIGAALRGEPIPVQGDGLQTRSLMYIDDLVTALMLVTLDPAADGAVLNAGNPGEVTMLDLARRIRALTGSLSELAFVQAREDDPRRRCPDIELMTDRYGWTPTVSLDDGLRLTIASTQRKPA